MSKIFISYSHKDQHKVQPVVDKIRDANHEIWIDESKLSISDTIASDIQKNIIGSDYVIVFLSTNSMESKWVSQEIYETLYQELKNGVIKLIPCLLDECVPFKAFNKTKIYNRFYQNFLEDEQEATKNVLSILNAPPREVFNEENYAILNIPIPNLEIYLSGETYGWDKNSEMRYFETVGSYLLFGFKIEKYKHFKHFVLSEETNAEYVRGQLKSLGYIVTGVGSIDDETDNRKIWFKVKPKMDFSNHPFKISDINNQWI